jgi:transposase
MDNLGSHKGKVVRELIRSSGAKLFFLPKYSPDLNPIEQVFANSSICCAKPTPEPSTPCAPRLADPQSLHARRMRQPL